jgi:hypothetical protein
MADSYTKLLLHCNGDDASTTITDSSPSPHTMTAESNAQLDTAQKEFGTASVLFAGSNDVVTTPHNSDLNFGTSNFTIDFWIRWSDKTGEQGLFWKQQDVDNRWFFYKNPSDQFIIAASIGGVTKATYITDGVSLSNDTWYHIAIVRNGTTMLFFLNGVSKTFTEAVAVGTNNFGDNTGGVIIGAQGAKTYEFLGWMDEIRWSNVARWTSNFTPPTDEYNGVVAPIITPFKMMTGFGI